MRETGTPGTESNIHPTSGAKSLLTRLSGLATPHPQPARGKGRNFEGCAGARATFLSEEPEMTDTPGFTLAPLPCPRLGPVLSMGIKEEGSPDPALKPSGKEGLDRMQSVA